MTFNRFTSQVVKASLIDVLPFDEYAYVVKLNGSSILRMLEWSVAEFSETINKSERFLQMSGLHVS